LISSLETTSDKGATPFYVTKQIQELYNNELSKANKKESTEKITLLKAQQNNVLVRKPQNSE